LATGTYGGFPVAEGFEGGGAKLEAALLGTVRIDNPSGAAGASVDRGGASVDTALAI
jgi:hypothetical protein